MVVAASCFWDVFHQQGLGNWSEVFQRLETGMRFTFQQDNDPKHTAKATIGCVQGKHLNVLEWPIENLWYDLKIAVQQQEP
jgi:hypothetical protein